MVSLQSVLCISKKNGSYISLWQYVYKFFVNLTLDG